jgi:transcriptional regulator with XRE-family HTH domain
MIQPNLGRKMAELRKAKGFTQEELAEKCNVNVRTLQRIESGEVTPRSYTAKVIFAALDFNLYESNKSGSFIFFWLEHFYRYFLDLFNLKTHKMKKISILSIMFSAIILGLFALITDGKAQKESKTVNQINDTISSIQTKSRELSFSDFTAYGSFEENDYLIGRDIKFKLTGVIVNLKLLMFNKKTREFNSNFVKGTLFENKVEVSVTQDELVDKLVMYTADKVDKSKNKIILKGHAKITSSSDDYIEADEIIITTL